MSSFSIAGSWVYERLDNFLADYFKEFANFSREQNQEIEFISTEFINWFSENELIKVKGILEKLKNINMTTRSAPEVSNTKSGMQIKSLSPDSGRGLKIRRRK